MEGGRIIISSAVCEAGLSTERIKDVQQELQKATLYLKVLHCIVNNTLSRQEISLALGQKKVRDN